MRNIEESLHQHMNAAIAYGISSGNFLESDIYGIFLHGSQNYHFSDDKSDVDTKLVVVPSFNALCLNKKPISKELIVPDTDKEHCMIRDIRLVFHEISRVNHNALEMLYTDYKIVRDEFQDDYDSLLSVRVELVEENIDLCMSSAYHQIFQIMQKTNPSPKQIAHAVRMDYFLKNLKMGTMPYKYCMILPDVITTCYPNFIPVTRMELLSLKRCCIDDLDNCLDQKNLYQRIYHFLFQEYGLEMQYAYKNKDKMQHEKKHVLNTLDNILIETIRKHCM